MGPRTVVILRHAEKPSDEADPDLSPAGRKRAAMLAQALPKQFSPINSLFAAARSRNSNRSVETITPLANALGLEIDDRFADHEYAALAGILLNEEQYLGSCIIICWHHAHIPDLAVELGVDRLDIENAPGISNGRWDESVFDRLWILSFEGDAVQFSTETEDAV